MRSSRPAILCFLTFVLTPAITSASSQPTAPVKPLAILKDKKNGLDGFGTTVATSADGRTVVVGAPNSGGPGGAAYLFVEPPTGWKANQSYTAKLTGEKNSLFGYSVAISRDGNTVVVAAPYATVNSNVQGAAFVFEKPAGGWTSTSKYFAKLASSAPVYQGYLAYVATTTDTVVAGVPQGPFGPGVAFVFVRPKTGWRSMTQTGTLTPSDQTYGDDLGQVAISGNTVVVGAFQNDTQGLPGAAYVYVKPGRGWKDMTETAKLTASDGKRFDNFGISVAIQGSTIVAGAYQNYVGNGAAYIFVEPKTGWTSATETAELTAKNGYNDAWFGYAVSISGRTVAVGSPQASQLYLYDEPKSGWRTTSNAKLDLMPPSGYQTFGEAVGSSLKSMVVGSGGSSIDAPGAALVYGR
jgi:hypothetical protein